jgi:hypothetical protein
MDNSASSSAANVDVADERALLHQNLSNSAAGRSFVPPGPTETGLERRFFKMREAEWWNFIQDLNLEQRGALFSLVLNMHLNGSAVSNDRTHLAYMLGCHFNKAYSIVKHLIDKKKMVVLGTGDLFCLKVGEAWAERRERSQQAAAAGKMSGRTRRRQSGETSLDDIEF